MIKIHSSDCLNSCRAAVQRQWAAKLHRLSHFDKTKRHHNLGGLKISLPTDQGHIKIVLNIFLLMVHVCPGAKLQMTHRSERPGLHQQLELVLHWWFTCTPSICLHRPELHQCYPFCCKHVERLPFWFLVLKLQQNSFFHATLHPGWKNMTWDH